MSKKWTWYVLLALAAALLFTACNPNVPDQNIQQNIQPFGQGIESPQAPYDNEQAQEVAERLVEIATDVDEVNQATAVAAGRWAVVGIDVDEDLDRARVGSVKYSVAEALKGDPVGAYAIVTADVDTNARLQAMAEDIRAGEPFEGIMEELAAIVGRLMPQVPRDIEQE